MNNQPYVVESIVLARGNALIALVYMDTDKVAADGVNVAEYGKIIMKEVNAQMPVYSKLADVEFVEVPFEKTPKMSIKRFMYK